MIFAFLEEGMKAVRIGCKESYVVCVHGTIDEGIANLDLGMIGEFVREIVQEN